MFSVGQSFQILEALRKTMRNEKAKEQATFQGSTNRKQPSAMEFGAKHMVGERILISRTNSIQWPAKGKLDLVNLYDVIRISWYMLSTAHTCQASVFCVASKSQLWLEPKSRRASGWWGLFEKNPGFASEGRVVDGQRLTKADVDDIYFHDGKEIHEFVTLCHCHRLLKYLQCLQASNSSKWNRPVWHLAFSVETPWVLPPNVFGVWNKCANANISAILSFMRCWNMLKPNISAVQTSCCSGTWHFIEIGRRWRKN